MRLGGGEGIGSAILRWSCALAMVAIAAALASTGSALGEVLSEGDLSVSASGKLTPSELPRSAVVPVSLQLGFTSETADGSAPELSRIEFAVARNVEIHTAGIPSCSFAQLYSSVASPGHSCAKSLVGRGVVDSEIALPLKAPVEVKGKLTAFYVQRKDGRFILARVQTGAPLPLVYVIPFKITRKKGTFSTSLAVRKMHRILGECIHPGCFSPYTLKGVYSRISKLDLVLHRRFSQGIERDSLVSARCAAPQARQETALRLAEVLLAYADPTSTAVTGVVHGNCRVAG